MASYLFGLEVTLTKKQDDHNLIFSGLKEYQEEVLKMHNKYRKIHKARALKLDGQLSKDAMAYARSLAKAGAGIKHSRSFDNVKVGENLLTSAVPISGATVVKTW